MKTETIADQVAAPSGNAPNKFKGKLLSKLDLLGQAVMDFFQNLDFALQVRVALWVMERRRRRGEQSRGI